MLIVETIARIRREHFIKGKTIKEIGPGPEGVAEHGAEGAEVGRDLIRVRACCPATTEAGTMGSRTRPLAGGECGQVRS
jgi:hypothetical protein